MDEERLEAAPRHNDVVKQNWVDLDEPKLRWWIGGLSM